MGAPALMIAASKAVIVPRSDSLDGAQRLRDTVRSEPGVLHAKALTHPKMGT